MFLKAVVMAIVMYNVEPAIDTMYACNEDLYYYLLQCGGLTAFYVVRDALRVAVMCCKPSLTERIEAYCTCCFFALPMSGLMSLCIYGATFVFGDEAKFCGRYNLEM